MQILYLTLNKKNRLNIFGRPSTLLYTHKYILNTLQCKRMVYFIKWLCLNFLKSEIFPLFKASLVTPPYNNISSLTILSWMKSGQKVENTILLKCRCCTTWSMLSFLCGSGDGTRGTGWPCKLKEKIQIPAKWPHDHGTNVRNKTQCFRLHDPENYTI